MGENQNPYSKPSPEEQEFWWKEGTKGKNFKRLYDARIAKRESWNTRNGITTTYYNEKSNLPEFTVTAPKETEKQKLAKRKQEKENLIDLAITGAGFVPGLDTAADIVDIGRSLYKGDYSGVLFGLAAAPLFGVSGPALKKGFQTAIQKFKNYRKASNISSVMDESLRLNVLRQNYLIKQGSDPTRTLNYQKVGMPEFDSKTFYHSMKLPFGQPVRARSGQVRLNRDKIVPVSGFNGQEGKIWWDKGNVPTSSSAVIITSKSPRINENVLEHPEKYSISYGNYSPSYFTSGEIPLSEVKIYERNPFTGHFDSSIPYVPTRNVNKSIIDFNFDVLQDSKDIEMLKTFAKKYGYTLPTGIERYSGKMLDKEFKRLLKKHNTFGRGVSANNVNDAEKFLTTVHSGTDGGRDGMPPGKTGIYTMNSISPYGNYQGIIQRKLDFSGPRSSWIDKNDIPYLSSKEISKDLQDIQYQYMQQFPHDGSSDYFDKMWKYIKDNYPKVFNSNGQIYKINNVDELRQIGNPGIVIHGGNVGERVLNAVRIFKPYSNGVSTRGFSHKAYKEGGKL